MIQTRVAERLVSPMYNPENTLTQAEYAFRKALGYARPIPVRASVCRCSCSFRSLGDAEVRRYFSLAVDGELCAAVLLVAGFILLRAKLLFLAVAHGADTVRRYAGAD